MKGTMRERGEQRRMSLGSPGIMSGKSITDLAWCSISSLHFVVDFSVLHIVPLSDHLLIIISFVTSRNNKINSTRKNKLTWKQEYALNFTITISEKNEVTDVQGTVNEMSATLKNKILVESSDLGLLTQKIEGFYETHPYTKPWFNADCVRIKNDIKNKLVTCKNLNYPNDLTDEYNFLKKHYKNSLTYKRKVYEKELTDLPINAKKLKDF